MMENGKKSTQEIRLVLCMRLRNWQPPSEQLLKSKCLHTKMSKMDGWYNEVCDCLVKKTFTAKAFRYFDEKYVVHRARGSNYFRNPKLQIYLY